MYAQAIECNPTVSLLRVGMAELEELSGSAAAAEDTLRNCFEQIPCGFTFSLYQRFVRRKHGKVAARKLFSGTLGMRNANPKLGYEVGNAKFNLLSQKLN